MAPPVPETKRDREAVARAIATSSLFRPLEADVVQRLAAQASIVRLELGERLWARGALSEHFHIVLRGVLGLQRTVAGGERTLVALFGPGEAASVPATLERDLFRADAYAVTHLAEVLRVRAEPVLELLARDARLAASVNRALLDHCRLMHTKIDILAAGSVQKRLAAFLLELIERFGDEHDDGTTHVPLRLSRAQLAAYVGARVETTIRILSSWQKASILETTRAGFEIASVDALRAILEEGASPTQAAEP